jgi:N-acyl-D-amino-acid deacylase
MDRRGFLRAAGGAAGAALAVRGEAWAAAGAGVELAGSAADGPARVLRGAVVYDGTGAAPVEADVALAGERITAVGRRLRVPGAEELELRGLALAPGFVDIHTHTDLTLLVNPRAESKVRQGVTTEIAGQDGSSVGPWTRDGAARVAEEWRARYGVALDFADLGGFFRRLQTQGTAVNLGSMVGAGTVRGTVVGADDRPATEAELAAMVALVEAALEQGACGLSTGLEYAPGAFASTDELVALAAPLRRRGLAYATHMRNEDDELFAAVEEAVAVGRRAGVPVQISHLKAQGQRNWWKARPVLGMLEEARSSGVDVHYDRYPYTAFSTGITNLFPIRLLDGGTEAFLGRLAEPAGRDAIRAAVGEKVAELGGWDRVRIASTGDAALAGLRGRGLGELAAEWGLEPHAALLRLVLEDRARTSMVAFGMSEENTERILAHPLGMIASDGGARATYGPLSEGAPHPRAYGTFPRVLGHYCRERRLMPLETAIHKMTAMPAAKLGLADRGRIAPGLAADLVAFDAAAVADRATFEDPHRYPAGVHHVWVNGVAVVRDGEHTGALPGRVMRPGRAGRAARQVSVRPGPAAPT